MDPAAKQRRPTTKTNVRALALEWWFVWRVVGEGSGNRWFDPFNLYQLSPVHRGEPSKARRQLSAPEGARQVVQVARRT